MDADRGNRARSFVRRLFHAFVAAGVAISVSAFTANADSGERIVVDALSYPWSAIGRVNVGGHSHCTGFLISERHVLTAGHCLFDRRAARWRTPQELHFVAGYQFDRIEMHSRIAFYRRDAGREPMSPPDIESAARDWALLTLVEPLGRVAGWLEMTVIDLSPRARTAVRPESIIQAGYSTAAPHAITLNRQCEAVAQFPEGNIFAHRCAIMKGDSGSPWLIYGEGRVRVAGIHVLSFDAGGDRYAGVLSLSVFSRNGLPEARRAFQKLDLSWGAGRMPVQSGPVRIAERKDLDSLLLKEAPGSWSGGFAQPVDLAWSPTAGTKALALEVRGAATKP